MDTLVLQFCIKKVDTPDARIMWNFIRSLFKCWGLWCEPYLEKYFWRDKRLSRVWKFHVSMSHILRFFMFLFFIYFSKLQYIYRDIFLLPSPFSVLSQEPKVLEILLRAVCIANCPISQALMALSATHRSLCVCHAPAQTQLMTVTESQAKWPKQTLWYTGGWKGSLLLLFKLPSFLNIFKIFCS